MYMFLKSAILCNEYSYLRTLYFPLHFPVLQDLGPEFIRVLDEPLVVLELPASIVVSTVLIF